MSAFCVYGMTRTIAEAKARKMVSAKNKTPEQWEVDVQNRASKIFDDGKPLRCSNTFDAPQYAQAFIDVADKTNHVCGATIYARYETDKVSKKTGKKLIKWREYKAEQ